MGGPDSELATVERNKALGDVMRSSGMQDAVRDFMISQIKQRIKCYLKFGTPELIIKMSGEKLIMPMTGKEIVPGTEMALGGSEGLSLDELITGDIDLDFVFDVDIQSAARPDFPVIRKQLAEGMVVAGKMEPMLRAEGKKPNYAAMLEDYFSTFDAIPNADKYIVEITPEEKAAMMAPALPGLPGGVPNEAAIARGAEAVNLPLGAAV